MATLRDRRHIILMGCFVATPGQQASAMKMTRKATVDTIRTQGFLRNHLAAGSYSVKKRQMPKEIVSIAANNPNTFFTKFHRSNLSVCSPSIRGSVPASMSLEDTDDTFDGPLRSV